MHYIPKNVTMVKTNARTEGEHVSNKMWSLPKNREEKKAGFMYLYLSSNVT